MSALDQRSITVSPSKRRMVIPGSAILRPVAGTPMNSLTCVPVMVNLIVSESPDSSISWKMSCGLTSN